jgi:DNA-binding CsgD family transcriptional regulator
VVGVEGEDAKRLERLSEARGKYAAAVVSELLREPSTPPRSGIRSRPSTGAGTDLGEAIVHGGAWVSSGAVDDADRREAELALLLLLDARWAPRLDADGVPVALEDQDRARWDAARIAEGRATLHRRPRDCRRAHAALPDGRGSACRTRDPRRRARDRDPGALHHVEVRYAVELLSGDASGVGYLLKQLVVDLDRFFAAPRPDPRRGVRDRSRGGWRPRRTALKGVEALTVSERRAATLTAEGGTTCEIGQALFVTPKTVEVHLGNVYRKQRLRVRPRKPHDDGDPVAGRTDNASDALRFLALRLSGHASPGSGRRAAATVGGAAPTGGQCLRYP